MEYNTELKLTLKNTDYIPDEGFETGYGDLTVELLTTQSEESKRLEEIEARIEELDVCIDNLTNHADKLDYIIAMSSGILAGLLDALFVGALDWDSIVNPQSGDEFVDDLVKNLAEKDGYKGKNPVRYFEDKFHVKQDAIWKGKKIGVSPQSHHLDDLAHHPTIAGLASAILVEFFQIGFFSNKDGEFHALHIPKSPKDILNTWLPVVISGVMMWIANVAEQGVEQEYDKEIPAPIKHLIHDVAKTPAVIQILKVSSNWAGHFISDINGSQSTMGGGMGIPGLYVSFMKEVSMLPGINKTNLPEYVNDLFVNQRIDLRDEMTAIMPVLNTVKALSKQSLPIIVNEVIVRSFYFVRHLVTEIKEKNDFGLIDWNSVLPFGNRTIARMMTVSLGTFHAVDVLDAAIEGAIHCKGQWAEFGRQALLRLNFVGIGRFTIALGNEAVMGWKKYRRTKERMILKNEVLCLMQVKLYQGDVLLWEAVGDAEYSIESLYDAMYSLVPRIGDDMRDMGESLANITDMDLSTMDEHNAGLTDELLDIL